MDWKVVAVVAAVAVILISAALAGGLVSTDIGADSISGFFTALSGGGGGNISINAILDFQPIEFDTGASSIEVEVLNPASEITVARSKVDLSAKESAKLEIKDWKGKISAGNVLTLDGTASQIRINGVIITPMDKNSKLLLEGLDYKDLKVHDVSLPQISFESARGYIYVNDGKTTVHVEDEPVEIGSFSGGMTLDSSLRLDGTTNRLVVSGENQMSIQ